MQMYFVASNIICRILVLFLFLFCFAITGLMVTREKAYSAVAPSSARVNK
jgi:hypothetical protein